VTEPAQTSRWEWAAGVVSAAIVVSAIATLLVAGRRERTPPVLSVHIEGSEHAGDHFRVRFVVRNEGGTTAAEVVVRGELLNSSQTKEESNVTFDYVPDGSERRGALLFTGDPQGGRLTIRPLGYREP
jgi:uncharacterized protein (TIGR02588 family)